MRTEERAKERSKISSAVRSIRIKQENKERQKKQNRNYSFTNDIMIAIYGNTSASSRSHLSQLENGHIAFGFNPFYKYLKVIGLSDDDISREFLNIAKG